jgi:hypothetical protein
VETTDELFLKEKKKKKKKANKIVFCIKLKSVWQIINYNSLYAEFKDKKKMSDRREKASLPKSRAMNIHKTIILRKHTKKTNKYF